MEEIARCVPVRIDLMRNDQVRNPEFESVVRATFGAQQFMSFLGASLTLVAPGEVEIALELRSELCQQGGSAHAGVIAAIGDSACGLAALTLMAAGHDVLSVEFKLNLLTPAVATTLITRGRVVRSGRTLTVCSAEILGGDELVATMLGTMIARARR